MALCDNDSALVCKKDGLIEIRSMSVRKMGQFTRSIGHEILQLSALSHHLVKMCLYDMDDIVRCLILMLLM